jgi:peptidyl-prolyl cis-trans isomerase B (cyclophilin B)
MPASRTRAILCLVGAAVTPACRPCDAGHPVAEAAAYLRIVAAEDARPTGGAHLHTLLEAAHDSSAFLRAAAVRGLGRLENPAMLGHIAPLLVDPDTAVRAQAANAMAQAVFRGAGADAATSLLARVGTEGNAWVRGVLARSLGRLSLDDAGRATVADALLALSRAVSPGQEGTGSASADAPPAQLEGVALGMESFARGARGRPLGEALLSRLHALALYRPERPEATDSLRAARIRELALMALGAARALDADAVHVALADPAVEVRLAAVSGALFPRGAPPASGTRAAWSPGQREALVTAALNDPSPEVRILSVRALAGSAPDAATCARLESVAAGDADTGVRLAALDGLGRPCPDPAKQVAELVATAKALKAGDDVTWHAPAHALVALAHVDALRARGVLPTFVGHADPFVRMYAARAAGAVGDVSTLTALAGDSLANVRTEAVQQLAGVEGGAADTVLVRTLATAEDPQLVIVTAHLLEGMPGVGKTATAGTAGTAGTAEERRASSSGRAAGMTLRRRVADAALETLDRISRSRQETLRDARLALLGLIGAAGAPGGTGLMAGRDTAVRVQPRDHATLVGNADTALVGRIEVYLGDYDPAVADSAGAVLHAWTGRDYTPDPHPPAHLPLPTPEELRAMEDATVVLHMARGGSIELRLLPLVAPTNAYRLYEQARSGVLDGRTFHRVVPDFVIQGGSPDANEYSGYGTFTRDELGLPVQWRGTVGLSTRGRDTGDGQLYVNLVDNVRLDHDYTVLAVVTSGMDVADRVLEGDVIRHAEVRPGSRLGETSAARLADRGR